MVTEEMPPGKATDSNSFGLLPVSPRQTGPGSHATLIEKAEVADATWFAEVSKAS